MKKLFTLCFSLLFISTLAAQNKTYSMQDAVLGLYTNLVPENIQQIEWIPTEEAFTKLNKKHQNSTLIKVNANTLKEEKLFSLSQINQSLFGKDSIKKMPAIKWKDAHHLYFKNGTSYYIGTYDNQQWQFKKWVDLPENSANFQVDTQKMQIAYTRDNNLYITDAQGQSRAITKETNKDIVSGQLVSRQEFGINQGVFFSPNGNYLAFYQKDESQIPDYPIVDWAPFPAKDKPLKYPMAGGKTSQKVSLGIYNINTQKTLFLKVDKADDDYITNVTWGPEEKLIYAATFTRDQKHLTLKSYKTKSGEPQKTILKENNDKYVHPQEPLYFIPGQKNQFVWWSEKDGFMHLYRYNIKGKLLNKITSGDWVVNSIEGYNPKTKELIITSSKLSPMDRNIYAVNYKTGKLRRLDKAKGMHTAKVSDNGTYFIDQYSNYKTPNNIRLANLANQKETLLLDAENPLKDYAQPNIKEMTITAADGKTPLYARMILPPNFDKTKKYPVIVYLYNGPGVQLLHHSFPESGNLWYDLMAQKGYIVFTMDGRGSTNRGIKFEQVTYRHLGTHEMEDQLKGVEYLKSLDYVDADRLGVHGWSFGGFMTTSLMLKHPDVFKVGVAGGPVIDWKMYEIMYTERYMDPLKDNPEGYAEANLLDKVKNLKGKLMIIHGAQDNIVVWQHSMKFLHECIQNNIQLDYFVYPVHPHNVIGKDRIHLMQKITNYFDDFLK